MIAFLGLVFAIAFLVTADLIPWVIRWARKHAFLDHPGPRKVHAEPMPYGGGIAVAAGLLGTVFVGTLAAWLHARHGWFAATPPEMADKADRALQKIPTLLVFSLGSLVILALGLLDDRRRLSGPFKLGVQAIVAAGVALGGERLGFFTGDDWLGAAVTILWILGVTNAFNLLDHMDGLSSGVAAIAAAAFLVVAWQTEQYLVAALLAALLGACTGFLVFNFPPARIFLGDAGSLFIGFWLACLTISFTFFESRVQKPGELYTYFVPLAVLSVPLFDTSVVALIRLRNRRSIFEGDRNHLAHRLTAMGMSPRLAVLTIYGLTLNGGLAAVLLYHVRDGGAVLILAQLLLTFGIITILEAAGRHRPQA
jgi:UDP-GlcNAc:undecaprenyl-phosphate GlcNAc-1-phosphate transferase